jgi:hypothetical protein
MTTSAAMADPLPAQSEFLDVLTCDFETLMALAEQMPSERFEQIKQARPDFAAWLDQRR